VGTALARSQACQEAYRSDWGIGRRVQGVPDPCNLLCGEHPLGASLDNTCYDT
jgi:hypothetical protein